LQNCESFKEFSALLLYESTLTIKQEIQLIWKRPLRPGSILYLLARYSTMLYFLISIMYDFWRDEGFTEQVMNVHTMYISSLTTSPMPVSDLF
jgi:hypothetical protein